jgi:hypothetical protein
MKPKIGFDPKKIKVVSVDSVRPNTWNPKSKGGAEFEKVKKSIETKGQRAYPIIVRENKGYEIIDGEQRWTACKELGFKEVLIYDEGKVTDKEAKELTIWYQQQVPFDHLDLSYLITELKLEHKDIELPYNELELEEMKKISEFTFEKYSTERPSDDTDSDIRTLSITMPKDKYDFITQAFDAFLAQEDLTPGDYGRALELIVADYVSGK